MKDVQGKVGVVTGASSGIGRAIAIRLGIAGCKVAPIARGKAGLNEVVKTIRKEGGTAEGFPCDLNDNAKLKETLKAIESKFGTIDILVNNVGVGTFKPIDRTSYEEVLAPIQLPFGAALVASHTVIPGMLNQGSGHIVNLISPAGILPLPNMVPYTATRFAITGLSHALHEELSRKGIGVTLVCPCQVNTGYLKNNDADMGWYPKLSQVLPVLEPEVVGEKVLEAIVKNKKDMFFPPILNASIRFYQKFPEFSFWFLRFLGILQPTNK